jgi:hypothetical protein
MRLARLAMIFSREVRLIFYKILARKIAKRDSLSTLLYRSPRSKVYQFYLIYRQEIFNYSFTIFFYMFYFNRSLNKLLKTKKSEEPRCSWIVSVSRPTAQLSTVPLLNSHKDQMSPCPVVPLPPPLCPIVPLSNSPTALLPSVPCLTLTLS